MVPIERLKFLEEITKWSNFKDDKINHTYITVREDNKTIFIGHIPRGTQTVRMWSQPIKIDMAGRKFRKVAAPYFAEEQIYGKEYDND